MLGQKQENLAQKFKNRGRSWKHRTAHWGWGMAAMCIQTRNNKKYLTSDLKVTKKQRRKIDDETWAEFSISDLCALPPQFL